MSLVALDGTPLVTVGAPLLEGRLVLPSAVSTLQDAAKEACMMIGQIFTDDGGSHTIDTTGSSSLGWLAGAVTFANGASTFKVGLAGLDTATGPPARPTNVASVITFDVAAVFTGGGAGITASAWNESVPTTGTKTVANGDLLAFATQLTAVGGADALNTNTSTATSGPVRPSVTDFTGGAFTNKTALPNAVITFSDGHLGFFYGGFVGSVLTTTQTYNSSSSPNEYGNFFQMPVPTKVYGITANCSINGDTDIILYSDPLGTPVAQKTVSFDLNVVGVAANGRLVTALFPAPYSTTASQPLAAIMKPTSATNISAVYKTFNASAHQKSETLGANGYAVNRASGAFAAQNSNKDRFAIGLLVGAFDNAANPVGQQCM